MYGKSELKLHEEQATQYNKFFGLVETITEMDNPVIMKMRKKYHLEN